MSQRLWVVCVALLGAAVLVDPARANAARAYVANARSNSVSVIDTATERVLKTITSSSACSFDEPYGVAVNHAGTKAYVTNNDDVRYCVIDTSTYKVLGNSSVLGGGLQGVAVSPDDDGRVYVAQNAGGYLFVTKAENNDAIAKIFLGDSYGPQDVVVAPNGATIYVSDNNSHYVSVINAAALTKTADIDVGSNPAGLAIPSDEELYAAINSANYILSIKGERQFGIKVGDHPLAVAVSPDGKTVYVTTDNGLAVVDRATEKLTTTVSGIGGAFGLAVTPDGSKVYATDSIHNQVAVIDPKAKTVKRINVGKSPMGIFITP